MKVSSTLFNYIQILRCKGFDLRYLLTIPYMVCFSSVITLDWSLSSVGDHFPQDAHKPLGCASVLTRHHKDPTSFSFWLVFMLISHMGVPVPCDYWELRTQTCHIGSGCQFLNNSLYTHGQSEHQAFFIHFQGGWRSFLISFHGSTNSS